MVDFELYYREHPDKAPVMAKTEFFETSDHDVRYHGLGLYFSPAHNCSQAIQNSSTPDDAVEIYLTRAFLNASLQGSKISEYFADRERGGLDDDHMMLLPNLAGGFYLRGRRWRKYRLLARHPDKGA